MRSNIVALFAKSTTENFVQDIIVIKKGIKGNLGANAMKRVAAGAHLSTPRLFEPADCPDDRAGYCLDCS